MPLDLAWLWIFRMTRSYERLASRGRQDDQCGDDWRTAAAISRIPPSRWPTTTTGREFSGELTATGTPEEVFARLKRVVELAKQPSN